MRVSPVALLTVVAALALPAGAVASPVLVLGHHGQVTRRDDPFLGAAAPTPAPVVRPAGGALAHADAVGGGGAPVATGPSRGTRGRGGHGGRRAHRPAPVTVGSVLARLRRAGQITGAADRRALGAFDAALGAERRLGGTRRTELGAVTTTVHDIAAAHQLWPSRLPAIVATLNANRRWWTQGTLLASGARVELAGSQLVWEYYPGQGIQLQVLGTFGKADGLYSAGPAQYPAMERLLAEMIPLASDRGGGLTWEYYFSFDGGSPPWTSAMSQATGLEALTRAYEATHDPYYLQVAQRALPVFRRAPPAGVAIPTARGLRFVQYTFAPGTAIINAFLQTLIGLHDYAAVSGNETAAGLFARGNAEAAWEVPHYNTGAWSLYQPGSEDDLSYHELVTGFLAQLCSDGAAPVYCATARAFTGDLTTPPVVTDLTGRAPARRTFSLRFSLSKVSHVGLVVARGAHTALVTSASFAHGVGSFAVGKLPPGSYSVTLTATDLAGNFTRTPGTLTVSRSG